MPEQIACKKCGKCCEIMFFWLGPKKPMEDFIEWANLHEGVKVVQECGAWALRIQAKCTKLKDGLCTIYKDRPQCCEDYKCWDPLWPKP